jgi:peptidoglycan-associated lipoprotein
MKKSWWSIIIIAVLGIGFLTTGCAKKNVVEKTPEVKPPVAQSVPQAPELGKPKQEAKVEVSPLADEIKAFESEDIHFDFDKSTITPRAKDILTKKAAFLKDHPDVAIRIEGNCDERGTVEYNLALGDRRAKAAQDDLIFLGIAADRISTASYGKERPLDPRHDETAWAKNRRDHFVIVKK